MFAKNIKLVGLLLLFVVMVVGEFHGQLASTASRQLTFTVCARMDIWGLSEVAEKLCIGACCAQNCGTGKCVKQNGRPVCVCNRCANGGGAGIGCLLGK